MVPPGRFERPHTAPEADALSTELRGLFHNPDCYRVPPVDWPVWPGNPTCYLTTKSILRAGGWKVKYEDGGLWANFYDILQQILLIIVLKAPCFFIAIFVICFRTIKCRNGGIGRRKGLLMKELWLPPSLNQRGLIASE